MADADRIKLSSIEESEFGVTPSAVAAQGALTVAVQPIGESKATGVLTIAVQPSDGDMITVDNKTYTFQTVLTDVDGNVLIGVSKAATQLNLENAFDLAGGTPGTDYALSMTAHPTVDLIAFGATTVDEAVLNAKVAGTAGNAFDTLSAFTSGSNFFGAATLGSGVNPDTFTIGTRTYTMRNTFSSPAVDSEIKVGSDVTATQNNIVAALNLSGTLGLEYSTVMTINANISASGFVTNVSTLTDKTNGGTASNSLALTSVFASGSNFFDSANLGGITAGTDVQFEEIRFTGESLAQETDTSASAEIRDDRQLADVVRTNLSAGGDINTEISYESHDKFIAAGMFSSDFPAEVTSIKSTYFIDSADNSLNDEANGLIALLNVGDWIKMSGWTNEENNAFAFVKTLTAAKAVLVTGAALVSEQDLGVAAQGELEVAVQPTPGERAESTLTASGAIIDGETVEINGRTYTFKNVVAATADEINIDGSQANAMINLRKAINLEGIGGTDYGSATTINADVFGTDAGSGVMEATAKLIGVAPNSFTTTETGANLAWTGATLDSGNAGIDPDTFTLGINTYSFLDNSKFFAVDEIQLGGSLSATQANIVGAINDSGTPGTDYSAATVANTLASAGAFAANVSTITALLAGTAGNSIVSTSAFTSGSNFFDDTTLGSITAGSGNADTVTILVGGGVINGVTQRSFTIEKEYTDLVNVFAVYVGMHVSSFNMNVATEEIMTGGFSFLGKNEASAVLSQGTVDALELSTNPVMEAIKETNEVIEGGVEFGATQLAFTIENNLRGRTEIGKEGLVSVGAGTVNATGTLQAVYKNIGVIQKYLDFVASSIAFVGTDAAGNNYLIHFPKIKYTSGQRVAGGQNTDVLADMEFTAIRCPSLNYTVKIVKFTGPGLLVDC